MAAVGDSSDPSDTALEEDDADEEEVEEEEEVEVEEEEDEDEDEGGGVSRKRASISAASMRTVCCAQHWATRCHNAEVAA